MCCAAVASMVFALKVGEGGVESTSGDESGQFGFYARKRSTCPHVETKCAPLSTSVWSLLCKISPDPSSHRFAKCKGCKALLFLMVINSLISHFRHTVSVSLAIIRGPIFLPFNLGWHININILTSLGEWIWLPFLPSSATQLVTCTDGTCEP